MGRTAKHNWKKLYLEYCQGRYKSVAEFAKKKGINPNQMRDGFRKVKNQGEETSKATENNREKQQKTTGKNASKKGTTEKQHPWEYLKQQFTDWPEEKLQAYLIQLEARKSELESVPFEDLTPAEVKELGQVRRERRAILSDPDPEVICSAHNRDGSPCGNPAERGKRTCWNHGGAPGSGPPKGTQNNLKHGLYAKILPDCEEFRELVDEIEQTTPLEKIDQAITLLQSQIAWAQKIMFVKSQDDIVKHLKRQKDGDKFSEEEWEFQYPWDRQASFLAALARSATALEKLIVRYEAMSNDEQKLKVEKLRAEIGKLKGPEEDGTLDDLTRALKESRARAGDP